MKNFKKLALVLGIAGASMSVSAADISLEYNGVDQGTYAFDNMSVASDGTITVDLLAGLSLVPQDYCGTDTTWDGSSCVSAGPIVTCGINTTLTSGVCEAPAPVTCGTDTTLTNGVCVADAPDLTPPTLGITSSPSSMGDGVSSSTVTFQFSRPVTGFAQNDVVVSPSSHTLTGFTAIDSDTWQATLNRSGNGSGTVTVSVGSGTYTGTNGVSGGSGSSSVTLVGGSTNVGNCTVPNGVEITTHSAVAAFGQGGSIIEFFLPKRPTVWSAAFTTTNSSTANGSVNMGGTTATVEHTRQMWISECPGGAPLGNQSRCFSEGQDHFALGAVVNE